VTVEVKSTNPPAGYNAQTTIFFTRICSETYLGPSAVAPAQPDTHQSRNNTVAANAKIICRCQELESTAGGLALEARKTVLTQRKRRLIQSNIKVACPTQFIPALGLY
jgi:hypothetical protein